MREALAVDAAGRREVFRPPPFAGELDDRFGARRGRAGGARDRESAWQHHFGRGLVATPNDFGRTGAPPSHPELLDWLAGELIRNGWRLKPIHRLIMTSAAYAANRRAGCCEGSR